MRELSSMVRGPSANSPLAPFSKYRFDNGLTLIVREGAEVPICAVDCWVRVGTVDEDPRVGGICHYFEHMFFKGTPAHPVGRLDRLVKEMGGYNNAATSHDYTHYYVVVPRQGLAQSLELMADALFHAALPEEEIERERGVVKEEINRSEDDPGSKLYNLLFEELFVGSPYARPILGIKESLDRINREEFLRFHQAQYHPRNIVVIVSGDVRGMEVPSLAHDMFGTRENGRGEDRAMPPRGGPGGMRRRMERRDVTQIYLALGFVTPGLTEYRDSVALEVLATILGEGRSSRLYQELLEERNLVSAISAWSHDMRGAGAFGIEAVLRPEAEDRVIEALWGAVGHLRREGVREDEVEKARRMLQADFLYDTETNAAKAGTLGFFEMQLGAAERALEFLEAIAAVTPRACQEMAERYLDEAMCALVTVDPR